VVLRLTSSLDEVVCGFVDLAILGVMGNCAWGGFRPDADTRYFRNDTEPGTECGLRLQDAGAEDA
jgi:hypothetical protein